jgi:uncharacterized membrane protein YfcA
MTILILTLLAIGIAVGFVSGLLGIGGGIILTPLQYWLYTSRGLDPDLAIKISFATSLAVVLPTAASGVWRHQKLGNIKWKTAIFMGIFTSISSFIGASLIPYIPGSALRMSFGILALIIAIRMLTVKIPESEQPVRENLWLWFALALPVGLITGLLGIGGGVIIIPVLVLVLHFRMQNAGATSLAMILFTATGGIAGYIISGTEASNLPDYTLGYIYWPAWIALSITSIILAQFGAIVAHRMRGKQLSYVFIVLLIYIGLDMLGAISWIIERF